MNIIYIVIALILTTVNISAETIKLEGPDKKITIRVDEEGVPAIFAKTEKDGQFALGYMQAKDRFWQMDQARKTGQGRLAELMGPGSLSQDGLFRTLKIKENLVDPSFAIESDEVKELMQAYADGVNAYIMNPDNPIPPEYAAVELTRSSIEAWEATDGYYQVANLVVFLTVDTSDIDNSLALQDWVGKLGPAGFALYTQDVARTQTIDPDNAVTSPNFLTDLMAVANPAQGVPYWAYGDRINAGMKKTFLDKEPMQASNWIIISGDKSTTGKPILGNDPHLGLTAPSIWYQYSLTIPGVYSVSGHGTPAIPLFLTIGQSEHVAWGGTNSRFDLSDVYLEQLTLDPLTGQPSVVFDGGIVPLTITQATLKANILNGVSDTVFPVTSIDVLEVPHHGPVIQQISPNQALSIKLASLILLLGTPFSSLIEIDTTLPFIL